MCVWFFYIFPAPSEKNLPLRGYCFLDLGNTPLGNELLWRKGVANSESYFTITNLLSSKILTAISFNNTIAKDAHIIGLAIQGNFFYFVKLKNLMPCPSIGPKRCGNFQTFLCVFIMTIGEKLKSKVSKLITN